MRELRDKGLGLATISYDPVATLSAFASQHGITYPLLSDKGSAVIKRFGILDPVPQWALGADKDDPAVQADLRKYVAPRVSPMMVGIAFPGTFILDRTGRVRQRFFEDYYVERNTVANLLIKLGGGSGAVSGTRISTAHLDITTYPSNTAIAPGDRFSLVVDVQPHPRIHVYAPGVRGYRPIALKLEPNPEFRPLPLRYPASEIYFFKPLNERDPVYQNPVRLVQEMVLEGNPEAQAALLGKESVTVKGTLQYQACDDKECFLPVSVPLSWTMSVRPLIRERPRGK